MIDIGSAAALASSLKTAAEITKAIIGLRDASMIQDKVVELNGVILAAQSSALEANAAQFTLLDRIRELEEEIGRTKAWDAEKQRYALKQVGSGAFAYSPKPDMKGGEPDHWLCTQCFGNRKKSFLQAKARTRREHHKTYHCSVCRSEISVHYAAEPGKDDRSRTIKA